MPEDTQSEERATQPMPHVCPKCRDHGWWVDYGQRGEAFFFYCACPAGAQAKFEDEAAAAIRALKEQP